MLAIIVPTILATLGFAWWFRAGNPRAKRLPDWAYSGQIELVTWGIPLLTITLLGGVAWVGSHELDHAKPLPSRAGSPPLEVQVVSLDWKWLFIYPGQGVASVNQLVIPAGRPVHFSLTSASVMNAFFVPQLGSMIYVMNGMASDLNLQADQPGTFRGISSHFSGDGFPGMQTIGDPPATFRGVEPGLFQNIVGQELAPGPGPDPQPHPKQASGSPPGAPPSGQPAIRQAHTHARMAEH